MISIMLQNFFKKIQSSELKLEEAKKKKKQNIFKSNLKKILRGRFNL